MDLIGTGTILFLLVALSLLLFQANMFGSFLDVHLADAALVKGDSLDPFTFDKVVSLVIIICVRETDHVID